VVFWGISGGGREVFCCGGVCLFFWVISVLETLSVFGVLVGVVLVEGLVGDMSCVSDGGVFFCVLFCGVVGLFLWWVRFW